MNADKYSKFTVLIFIILIFAISLIYAFPAQGGQGLIKAKEKTASLNINIIEETEDYIIIDIIVNPGGQAINAAGIYLEFSNDIILARHINTDNSFCELFIARSYSNASGTANILCILPTPGISNESIVGQIVFDKIESGWAVLEFGEESQILANDGFGTNVLKTMEGKIFFIN